MTVLRHSEPLHQSKYLSVNFFLCLLPNLIAQFVPFLRNGLKIDLSEPLNTSETDEEVGKDRELISDFMGYTSETQRLLTICDTANQQMRTIANK